MLLKWILILNVILFLVSIVFAVASAGGPYATQSPSDPSLRQLNTLASTVAAITLISSPILTLLCWISGCFRGVVSGDNGQKVVKYPRNDSEDYLPLLDVVTEFRKMHIDTANMAVRMHKDSLDAMGAVMAQTLEAVVRLHESNVRVLLNRENGMPYLNTPKYGLIPAYEVNGVTPEIVKGMLQLQAAAAKPASGRGGDSYQEFDN